MCIKSLPFRFVYILLSFVFAQLICKAQFSEIRTFKEDLQNGYSIAGTSKIASHIYLCGNRPTALSINSPWVLKLASNGTSIWNSDENWPILDARQQLGVIEVKKLNSNYLLCYEKTEQNPSLSKERISILNDANGNYLGSINLNAARIAGYFPLTDSTFIVVSDLYQQNADSLIITEFSTPTLLAKRRHSIAVTNNDNHTIGAVQNGGDLYITTNNEIIRISTNDFSTYTIGPKLKVNNIDLVNSKLIVTPNIDLLAYNNLQGYLVNINPLTLDTNWSLQVANDNYKDLSAFVFDGNELILGLDYNTAGGNDNPATHLVKVDYSNKSIIWSRANPIDSITPSPGNLYVAINDISINNNGELLVSGFYYPGGNTLNQLAYLQKINPSNGDELLETSFYKIAYNAGATAHAVWHNDNNTMVICTVYDSLAAQFPNAFHKELNLHLLNKATLQRQALIAKKLDYPYGSSVKNIFPSKQGTFIALQRGLISEFEFYDRNNVLKWKFTYDTLVANFAICGASLNNKYIAFIGFANAETTFDPTSLALANYVAVSFDDKGTILSKAFTNKLLARKYTDRLEVFTDTNQIFLASYDDEPSINEIRLSSYHVENKTFKLNEGPIEFESNGFKNVNRSFVKTAPGRYAVIAYPYTNGVAIRTLSVSPSSFTLSTGNNIKYVSARKVLDAIPYAIDTILFIGGNGTSNTIYKFNTKNSSIKEVYAGAETNPLLFNMAKLDTNSNRLFVFGTKADSLIIHTFNCDNFSVLNRISYKISNNSNVQLNKFFVDERNKNIYLGASSSNATNKTESFNFIALDSSANIIQSYESEQLRQHKLTSIAPFKLGKLALGGSYRNDTTSYGFINLSNIISEELDVSINEHYNSSPLISIYPNPSNGKFILSVKNQTIDKIELHDIDGRSISIRTIKLPNGDYQLEDLGTAGIRLLTIVADGKIQLHKLLKLD